MELRASLPGTVWLVISEGQEIRSGKPVVVLESMKMQHDIVAPCDAVVSKLLVKIGDLVVEGQLLAELDECPVSDSAVADNDGGLVISRGLDELLERHARTKDSHRPAVVEHRHSAGRRTARENIFDLVDEDSFVEYGPLVVAAQRRRRDLDDLIERTVADGLVGGLGSINRELVGPTRSRAVVMSYDYAVLAGTQGTQNHRKKDRLFDVAERLRLPVVFFAEGGGGRPGDTDAMGVSGLDCWAFRDFAALSGLVPLVGITGGYCFAGNAAILGCCDVTIAIEGSNIGMGGPAMIEGGGLGIFAPSEIGPLSIQFANGVVDLVALDDDDAVRLAKKYLSYFQGSLSKWECAPQDQLRSLIPENRVKTYEVQTVIERLFDTDSVLELRAGFGPGMVTALARLEGRPVGVIANNPMHLGGAIDSDGADKAARFMQLCDSFDLPIVTLVDTPGMMVGPAIEQTALVRHCSRLFVTGANVGVPVLSVVLRKSYGLGAQAMMGGSTKAPLCCIAWPTAEFGGMGLEGAVRLGYRKELEAISDPVEREREFQTRVDRMYEHGKALSVATHFEIDDAIDPTDTRRWLTSILVSHNPENRVGKRRPNIDTW